jgi:hypothetical protein
MPSIICGAAYSTSATSPEYHTTIHLLRIAGVGQALAYCRTAGQVYVVDAKQGTIIGSIDGQTLLPEVGWIGARMVPRLVSSFRPGRRSTGTVSAGSDQLMLASRIRIDATPSRGTRSEWSMNISPASLIAVERTLTHFLTPVC